MRCAACAHDNRDANRFCEECGAALARRCGACGREVAPAARFCGGCGAALTTAGADATGSRKVVTIVFADLIGSTSLHERLDAESVRRVMDRYYRTLHQAIAAHGGTVVKRLGDGVMAAFGVPRVGEDDAVRAVRAAVAMQAAYRALAGELGDALGGAGLRVAVNTGEVVVSPDDADVVGDPVNVAARLQQDAGDGDVLIGESTQGLIGRLVTLAPLGVLTLKGRAETVAAYRVVSLERPAGAPAIAFVGREDELRRLDAVYAAAVAAPAARLAVVLGSPGLGKSRLLDEFARRLDGAALVLLARCDAAAGATFAPLAGALRAHLQVDDGAGGEPLRAALEAALPGAEAERGRVVSGVAALLAGTPAPPEETFFVVRRYLAGLAAAQPVVLVIDDLQWAEPLLLDLTEHLVQWGAGAPLFVLGAARPELRERRTSLATPGALLSEVVTLSGLDAGAATRLAANIVGADALPAAVAGRVLATSEGNPLFVGELVRMLVQDGVLQRDGDRWIAGADIAALQMPPTIHALLAARLERLPADERAVLERAAVIGRHFSRAALAHLLPGDAGGLDARLESLRGRELIESDAGWFLGEPALRFHHVLVRDAAYRRLLKETRAELHARLAEWLRVRAGDAVEHDEIIGWHFEQAHQHLRELGALDAAGRDFGVRAARHLAAAGRRALGRDDLPRAANLLGRALPRLDADDATRAPLALDWCEALLSAGDVGPAADAIDELDRLIQGVPHLTTNNLSSRLRAWHACFAGQLAVLTDPQALRVTADSVAAAAQELAAAGDAGGEAKGHAVHALALARLGAIGACEAALDRALAAARRAGDRRRANAVLAGAPLAALWGPSPVTRASGRCLDVVRVLRITQGAPAVEAVALRCQAVLEALRGRTDAARRMLAASRHMVEELGITQRLLEADVFAGLIELLDGDALAAERLLRGAYDGLRAHGLGIDAAQAAALLGRALLAQDRADEAETLSHDSEALAGDDLKAAIAWRGVRAEALARRGRSVAGIELARAAVELAAATDTLLDHADARLSLAATLRAAGRDSDAAVEEGHAIALWEAKGATLLVQRASGGVRARPVSPAAPLGAAGDRRIRANAATRNAERFDAAIAARDVDALLAGMAEDLVVFEHRNQLDYGRAVVLTMIEDLLWNSTQPRHRLTALASLGESLTLLRREISTGAVDTGDLEVGAADSESLFLSEVDAAGRRRRTEIFAADQLAAAIGRLYEWHAQLTPAGAARARAVAIAGTVAAILLLPGAPAIDGVFAPDVESLDHRLLGFSAGRGAEMQQRVYRDLFALAADLVVSVEDVLALRPDALLLRSTSLGTVRASGGRFERPFIQLRSFDADGRLSRAEFFDTDDEAEALARFDALFDAAPVSAARRAAPLENAATRAGDRLAAAMAVRDWESLVALMPAGFRSIDRSRMVQLEIDRERYLETFRPIFDALSTATFTAQPLATRGDRLTLARLALTGSGETVGPTEIEWLAVLEVDADGQPALEVAFDADALDAATAELDARYAAGEAAVYPHAGLAPAFARAFDARDWQRLASLLAPDVVVHDHRLLGWETLHGPAAYVEALQSLVDLAPDVRLRLDHLAMSADGVLCIPVWVGTRDGGEFETASVFVTALDARGRIRAFDAFDLEQLDAARQRFAALRSPG